MKTEEKLKDLFLSLGRTALFVFDNLECFEGQSDGEVDEDGDFALFKPGVKLGIAMPFNRLVGWAYERKGIK